MNDFLSNFSGENYEKTRREKDKQQEQNKQTAQGQLMEETISTKRTEAKTKPEKATTSNTSEGLIYTKKRIKKKNHPDNQQGPSPVSKVTLSENRSRNTDEETEVDPTYKNKKIKKFSLIGLATLLGVLLLYFGYYQMTHVKVPDFEGKELSEARQWTTENGVKLQVEQKYDFEKQTNIIIEQTIKNKKIKKGQTLVVDASLGADPEEVISLPDFKAMKLADAKMWIMEQKADNIAIIEEYHDKVSAGDYLKFEFTNKDVKADNYKRKDKAKLYFSKGQEVFEKDIPVLDFAGKSKEEATDWAKKNEITLKIEEADSENVENGKIISQSISKDTKIAKKETLTVTVSTGRAVTVPDFSHYTAEEAESKVVGLQVQVKQIYSNDVPYGRFISQSEEIGKKYTEKEDKPVIQAVYSIGKPYIKDLRDNTLEGDLQKIFYDEYQSKGATITYQVYYVDSTVTKGTVVKMSQYNEFVPIDAVIQIGISKGNLKPEESKS